ncbi:MarR family winged helix-turn-helix transcriptional regulator [Streptomyces cupreus]|uniref:Winged helix-turn-helix transcriptional regulator n=1 Tax=Streptomyces cupreus TaxID=2759956 RepID=A0A7X1JAR0_9ACTN|nr:MarR family winged helix-turn-helix transcriptional regulator [Streptomyces cupreus]MBC2907316.1 winged helix-turn-helix transcriptional regulator [Streptomyces cupreus]
MIRDEPPATPDPRADARQDTRLGHLLRLAQVKLARTSAAALAPYGVDGHELAVLAVLSGARPLSQVEAAGRLGVDRTTMVSLLDGLEDHGLVVRRRSTRDRRKNIVELTVAGEECLRRAEQARRSAERSFLAPLDEETAATLIRALHLLTCEDRAKGTPG